MLSIGIHWPPDSTRSNRFSPVFIRRDDPVGPSLPPSRQTDPKRFSAERQKLFLSVQPLGFLERGPWDWVQSGAAVWRGRLEVGYGAFTTQFGDLTLSAVTI